MERVRRLSQMWNWLPAFRVVAETEHLPSASRELSVSISALSRTIKLLQDDLGVQLFQREGRRLALTPAGAEFLSAVRDAMRGVDDALNTLHSTQLAGSLRISASGQFSLVYVMPALARLRSDYPDLIPHLQTLDAQACTRALRQGTLDLAVLQDPVAHPDLTIERLSVLKYHVYCGGEHPLARHPRPALEDVLDHAFVAPPEGVDDRWPPHLPRRVGFRVASFRVAIDLCARGHYLAIFSDALANSYEGSGSLHRLDVDVGQSNPVYAIYRRPLGKRGRAEVLLAAIQAEVAARADLRSA